MFTVKIIDGKSWVVEVRKEPKPSEYVNPSNNFFDAAGYKNRYDTWLTSATKYPTLETHLSHWQALEGKEFDEKVFRTGYKCPKWICDVDTEDCQCYKRGDIKYAFPVLPEPNEDEVWEGVEKMWLKIILKVKHSSVLNDEHIDKIVKELHKEYNLSKK